ncbi:MAG: alanine racemase [Bacteroidia bacterium]
MAYIELYRSKLKINFDNLDHLFKSNKIEWAVVTKLLCGNKLYLQELINLGIRELCDSRVSNLKAIKKLDPNIQTVYIKPPAKRSIKSIVSYADVSFNTEFETIKMLSEEALKQAKIHRVVIMVEMGDLREGVMGEDLIKFYGEVFELAGIEIIGIGANINCLSGVLPTQDKYIQLSLYKQLIESKFNRQIPWITAGTSITIPLLFRQQMPTSVNHFRIGETLFFGRNLLTEETFEGMKADIFMLFTEIIEISEKPIVPIGYLAENPSGETVEVNEEDYGVKAYRAIVDVGLLDIQTDFIEPEDTEIEIVGASSDMLILDLGDQYKEYKVGDVIPFRLKYMGALGLFNSNYIEKRVVN